MSSTSSAPKSRMKRTCAAARRWAIRRKPRRLGIPSPLRGGSAERSGGRGGRGQKGGSPGVPVPPPPGGGGGAGGGGGGGGVLATREALPLWLPPPDPASPGHPRSSNCSIGPRNGEG